MMTPRSQLAPLEAMGSYLPKRMGKKEQDLRLKHQEKIMSLVLDIVNLSFRWHIKVEMFTWSSRKRLGVRI